MNNDYCYEFPVVRGVQAGRIFYMASVPMRIVQNMFRLDTGDGSALSRSQREVNLTRAKKFAEYLKANKETFVVPALTGFVNVEQGTKVEFKESNVPNVGVLSVPMDAALLFVDGQHRASGVALAMKDSDTRLEIGSQSTPVMLFENLTLEERQAMFSDINGNVAKPAQALSDAYNNRDDLAIFAKELAVTIPQLIDLVDFEHNVVSSKSAFLFSIKTVKEVSATVAGLKKNQSLSDSDKALITNFWKKWFEQTDFDRKFAEFDNDAYRFKDQTIITTGVVLKAAALAVKEVGIESIDFSMLSMIDWSRDGEAFQDRCVDAQLKTMKADSTATKLTSAKMLTLMGIQLTDSLAEIELKVFGKIEPIAIKPIPEDEPKEITEPALEEENLSLFEDWHFYINLSESDAVLAIKNNCKRMDLSNEQLEEAGEKLATVSQEGMDIEYIHSIIEEEVAADLAKKIYFTSMSDFITSLDSIEDQNEIHKTLLNIRSIRGSIKKIMMRKKSEILIH